MKQLMNYSEKDIKQIFNNFPYILLLLDEQTNNIILANKAACTFYGFTQKEFYRLPYSRLNGRENSPFPELLEDEKNVNNFFSAFTKHKKASGTIANVHVSAGFICVSSIRYILVIVNQYKITDNDIKKQSEQVKKTIGVSSFIFNTQHDSKIDVLAKKFNKLMVSKRLFLDPCISLETTASLMHTNRSYLSKAINEIFGTNFKTYINNLRIYEAIRIIMSCELPNYSIEGVAKTVGFTHRSTFITAFKNQMKMTPSEYLRNVRTKSKQKKSIVIKKK